MTPADLDFLTSPQGEALLNHLMSQDLSPKNHLALVTSLRKTYPIAHISPALTLIQTRQKAVAKFGDMAHHLFFTPDALEQASDPMIRAYRAQKFVDRVVVDNGCGIGADSLAIAGMAQSVIGVDSDPVRIMMARLNVERLGISNIEFVVDDVTTRPLELSHAFFFDPARRDELGDRLFGVENYIPPLSTIYRWDGHFGAVKVSPAVKLDELSGYDGQVEFISVSGDLKEAVLWLDGAKSPRATRITDGEMYHWDAPDFLPDTKPLSPPRAWLIEPDPAIIRAGLVQDMAEKWGLFMLDEQIAYLTGDQHPHNEWVRAWQIHDWMPFHLKKLRAYLRERHIGRITVKKRGSPLTPESLIAQIKPKGDNACTLALTQHLGNPIVIICAEYPN